MFGGMVKNVMIMRSGVIIPFIGAIFDINSSNDVSPTVLSNEVWKIFPEQKVQQ